MKSGIKCLTVMLLVMAAPASANKMPAPPVVITPASMELCPPAAGACAILTPGNYQIAVAPWTSRFVYLHEVGHIFDATVMDEQGRREFAALLRPRRFDVELFADAYAACARPTRVWVNNYGWNPHTRLHRRACGVILRAWARHQVLRRSSWTLSPMPAGHVMLPTTTPNT